MTVTPTAFALTGFIAWTLALLVLMEGIRSALVAARWCRPTVSILRTATCLPSCSGWPGRTPIAWRGLPLFGGLMLVALVTGRRRGDLIRWRWCCSARASSSPASTSPRSSPTAVTLRFSAFAVQMGIGVWLGPAPAHGLSAIAGGVRARCGAAAPCHTRAHVPGPRLPPDALQAFERRRRGRCPAFCYRPGQRQMAEQVARTFAEAALGKADDDAAEPVRSITVIQAGTGVGKSPAYFAPAVALALARDTRVLISTATVALQEQLVNKDLPALAAQHAAPFALRWPRGVVATCASSSWSAWWAAGWRRRSVRGRGAPAQGFARRKTTEERRIHLYATWPMPWPRHGTATATPGRASRARDWSPVAAERHTCTGRHCPLFRDCSYYDARTQLVGAHVIVANHDLVLSSMGSSPARAGQLPAGA